MVRTPKVYNSLLMGSIVKSSRWSWMPIAPSANEGCAWMKWHLQTWSKRVIYMEVHICNGSPI